MMRRRMQRYLVQPLRCQILALTWGRSFVLMMSYACIIYTEGYEDI